MKLKSLLYNRWVLYAVFFITVINLFHKSVRNQYRSIALFFCVGLLSSWFSKNLTIILATATIITEVASRFNVISTEAMTLSPTELKEDEAKKETEEDHGILSTAKQNIPSWLLGKSTSVKRHGDDDDVDDENKMPSKTPPPDYEEKFQKEAMAIQEKERKSANQISFEGSNLIDNRSVSPKHEPFSKKHKSVQSTH